MKQTYTGGCHCGAVRYEADMAMVAVMLSTLDDLSDADLASLPVMYVDGRNNNFAAPPAETRYL